MPRQKKASAQLPGRPFRLPVKGVVKARKCRHCGHHEIGIVTKNGNFIALKPGDNVALVKD